MTNGINVRLSGQAVPNLPPGEGSAALLGRLANTPSTARANQSIDQVKAFAITFVDKCWKDYEKRFPEAFSTRGNLVPKATPTPVFAQSQAEFDKLKGNSIGTSDMIAFVKGADPSRIYVHTPNLVKYANKYGLDYVKITMAHELIHCLTNGFILRSDSDAQGKTNSYEGVRQDLNLMFSFSRNKLPGADDTFTVQKLITEFAADHYANMATGIKPKNVAYSLVRDTGEKLLQLVGERVFRQAVIANDPAAYRQVIEAAKTLHTQNVKTNILAEKNDDVLAMRAAQAATPFGTPLNNTTLDKLMSRYYRESKLYENLRENFPDQIKNFDFRFFHAVEANFKSRGVTYDPDSPEASDRELSVAIQAVWPSRK